MVYVKLFTSIYQGTLRGDSRGLLVFTNLLAHCDKNGVVDIHPRAIAEEVGLPIEEVKTTLLMLESPDDESRSKEEQGRRIIRLDDHRAWGWTVVNYAKYRAIRNEDDRREQNRQAQERWRTKQKSSGVSQDKPQSAQAEAEAEATKKTSPSAPFALFWEAWPKHPRKTARIQCEKKWASMKLDAMSKQIISSLERAKRSEAWSEQGGKFIPAPLTWLNQARWEAPMEDATSSSDERVRQTNEWIAEQEAAKRASQSPEAIAAKRAALSAVKRVA